MIPRMFDPSLDWMESALCLQVDPDLFFPSPGENDRVRAAKRVCRNCPVASECLSWAVASPELTGILGGTTERDRQAIRRQQRQAAACSTSSSRSSTGAPSSPSTLLGESCA
jgi:WhiB family redox-sensing transcriptional regulator